MRVITEHRCTRDHRNATTFVRCAYPNLRAVTGRGFIAVITECDDVTVALFDRIRPAQLQRNELGVFGCGPHCVREHYIAAIDFDGPDEQEAS